MEISETLKCLRIEKGFSQIEIAARFNIPRSTYNNYERNIAKPDFDLVNKLAEFYGVSTDYLLGRTDEKGSENKVSEAQIIYDKLPAPLQKLFIGYGRQLLDTAAELKSEKSDTFAIVKHKS